MMAPVLLASILTCVTIAPADADVARVCLLKDGVEVGCAPEVPNGLTLWTIQRTPGAIYTAVVEDGVGNRSAASNPVPSLDQIVRLRRQLAGLEE